MSGCYRILPVLRVCACTSHGCSPVRYCCIHGLLFELNHLSQQELLCFIVFAEIHGLYPACSTKFIATCVSNTKHYGLRTEKISIGWMRRFTAVFKDCIGRPIPDNTG
jgi:hypothetical protein